MYFFFRNHRGQLFTNDLFFISELTAVYCTNSEDIFHIGKNSELDSQFRNKK